MTRGAEMAASAGNSQTEESVGPLKPFLVDLDERFHMILYTAIVIGSLWIAGLYTAVGAAMIPHLLGKRAVYFKAVEVDQE
jgi:hypothetical protein